MRACVLALALLVGACSSLERVHDPKFGALDKDQVASLIKSVRCELVSFYAANAARKRRLDSIRNALRHKQIHTVSMQTVLENRYFDLDTDAYGAFAFEAKVVDSLGLGTSSAGNILHSANSATQTFSVGPNLGSQGTYDSNFNFAIQQDATPDLAPTIEEWQVAEWPLRADGGRRLQRCYAAVVREHYDQMAAGKYPPLEQFPRITVDGGLPLAAWLQDNTTVAGVSRNILADVNPPRNAEFKVPVPAQFLADAADVGQMSYTFTVQYTVGADAKFSLVSSHWSPLAPDVSGSVVQTGVLSIYVNGYMTIAALGAKGGVVGINGRSPPVPAAVYIVNGTSDQKTPAPPYPPVKTTPGGPSGGGAPEGKSTEQRAPRHGPNRGQLLGPVTPFLLTPGP
jgi:hypothetical protein